MVHKIWFALFLFIPFFCGALELKPWFGNIYEAECRASVLYQNYDTIATRHKHGAKRRANDTFITLNIAYPFKRYLGQFESTSAHTRHQSNRIDNFRISGAYQWLNDDQHGDLLSLVTTIILTEPLSRALHDVSSFHHGHLEGEFCLSLGKKYGYPCSRDFIFRWWNVVGVGGADVGSCWYRGDAVFEYKYAQTHLFRGFINMLYGAGHKDLHPHHFKGYGPINHRSIDIGLRYSYEFKYGGTCSLQYARRVYAHNFPEDVNLLLFEYYLPFGHRVATNY